MRIAALVHQFPPDFQTGTEILCLRTMQALAGKGHEVRVFAADPLQAAGRAVREDRVEGVAVTRIATRRPRRLGLASRLRDEFVCPEAQAQLDAVMAPFRPDVIHVFHMRQFGLRALPRLAHVAPLVVTATDFHLACPVAIGAFEDGDPCPGPDADGGNCLVHAERIDAARGRARPILAARAALARLVPGLDSAAARARAAQARRTAAADGLRAATAILAGSARIRDMLVLAGADPVRVVVKGHGAPGLDVPPRAVGPVLTAGFFGTLAPHKGAHVFLDALEALPVTLKLRAIVAGPAGPDAAYAKAIVARAAGNARVSLRPAVANAAFGALLGEADIVVLPSLWDENRPLTLLAALESGRYVVASDMPGLAAEIAGGQGGEVFPPGDAAGLAAILARLAGASGPVQAARKTPARRPDFDAYVDDIERLLGDAARRGAP